jgi:hypothetical protein
MESGIMESGKGNNGKWSDTLTVEVLSISVAVVLAEAYGMECPKG